MEALKIFGNRSEYSKLEAAKQSMTVGQLIDYLEQFDKDAKVIISNDGGYTYGYVNTHYIDDDLTQIKEY